MSPFDLSGKVVWVTGAGKGLGRAIAMALAGAGARVAGTSRTESDLKQVAAELAPGMFDSYPASITDAVAVKAIVGDIAAKYGRLDGLINCAGISPTFMPSELVDDAGWEHVMSVNLSGTFNCCREAGQVMIGQRFGSIVNVTSVHATVGGARIAAYAASKGGVHALTKTLAVEWADRGVRVNALAPGYFHTDLSSGLLTSRHGERIRQSIPMGRIGRPAEIGASVVYLISDASAYVTGSTLAVDGGWSAW